MQIMSINAFVDNAKVMAKGQITIPKDVRDVLGVKNPMIMTSAEFLNT